MKFQKAKISDIPEIMEIIKEAQKYLKKEGIDQWQNNYPNSETLKEDIKNNNSYLLKKENRILATAAIIFGEDPTYNYIEGGEWISEDEYGVIHRAAVAKDYKGRGVISRAFKEAFKLGKSKNVSSIRVDTHQENFSMQRAIEKEGFNYCGIIYIEDGSKRLAYEKII